jgi:hypothetical protein
VGLTPLGLSERAAADAREERAAVAEARPGEKAVVAVNRLRRWKGGRAAVKGWRGRRREGQLRRVFGFAESSRPGPLEY